jgi:hypothetical protein
MGFGKMVAKAAVKANKNAGGLAAAGAVAGAGGAALKAKMDAKKAVPAKKTPPKPPAATMYNKGGSVCKAAPKKYNSGGSVEDVKTGYEKGIRSRTVMSDAVRRRMEQSGLEEPVLTKAKTTAPAETSQYAGKKLQISAERKAKQEAERKRLMAKQAALD